MPRRSAATIRPVEPDARFRNRLVQQLINKVMSDGKKQLAERIVYDALAIVGERSGEDAIETLEASIKQLTPVLEVRSRRVGGATYQVPVEVPARRARTLAIRWLVDFARNRREYSMAERLASEILDATQQQGPRGSARTTFTAWHRPIRPSRITAGSPASAMSRPILAIDIDGVISLFGAETPPDRSFTKLELVDGVPHLISLPTGDRLRRLEEHFELVWASGGRTRRTSTCPLSWA